jgi:hypothetical protein
MSQLNTNTPQSTSYNDELLVWQNPTNGEFIGIDFADSFADAYTKAFPGKAFTQMSTVFNPTPDPTTNPSGVIFVLEDQFAKDPVTGQPIRNIINLEALQVITGMAMQIDTSDDTLTTQYQDEYGNINTFKIPLADIRGTLALDYATTAEAIAGTNTLKVITPKTLQDAIGDNNLQLNVTLDAKENKTNKVTSLSPANDVTYPTTKAVADAIAAIPAPIPTTIVDNLTSTSATSALSAKQGKLLNDADIASGALVGTNIEFTKNDGSKILIDATAILADIRVTSGVYNSTTKAIDFTLSDSSTISVPVSALLPVTHNTTLTGDGSTTPLSVAISTTANNRLTADANGLYVSNEFAEFVIGKGIVEITDEDGVMKVVSNMTDLASATSMLDTDKLYFFNVLSDKNEGITLADFKVLVSIAAKATISEAAPATATENDTWIQTVAEDDGSGNGTFIYTPVRTYVYVAGAWELQSSLEVTNVFQVAGSSNTMRVSNSRGSAKAIASMELLPAATPTINDSIPFALSTGGNHRKTTVGQLKTMFATPDDVIDITGVTLPVTYPVTTFPGTPVFSPAGSPVTTAFYKLSDGTYAVYNGTQFISSPAPVSQIQNSLAASTTKAPTVDAVNTALATKATTADITAATAPLTAAIALKQDKSSVATHAVIAGTTSTSQIIRLTDQTQNSDINVDDLFSLPTIKNAQGKIVLGKSLLVLSGAQPTPTSTGNTTNLNSTFKDVLGDTWIVDASGVAIKAAGSALDFFRSGTGTTLPDGTSDTTENVSRIGKIGVGIIDPTTLTSAFDIAGTIDNRPLSIVSAPVDFTNSGVLVKSFDIPNASVELSSNIELTGVFVDTLLNIGQPASLTASTLAILKGRYLRVHNADSNTHRLIFKEIEILPGKYLDLQHNGRFWDVETEYLENWEGFEFTGTPVPVPAFASGTTTYVDVPTSSFIAPTAGDYWVKYTVYASNGSAIMPTKRGNDIRMVTDNVTGTFVEILGSVSEIGNIVGGAIDAYTKYFRVRTTRLNQAVKLQLNSIAGSTTIYQSATQLSTIEWKRYTTPVITSATAVKKFRIVKALAAGANTITDNLGLVAPFARSVEVRDNVTGELIACRITSETANTYILTVPVAVAATPGARITTIG